MKPPILLFVLSRRFKKSVFVFSKQGMLSEKSRKTSKNYHFSQFWSKMFFFVGFSWFFFSNHTLVRACVFCVAFNASARCFWNIKINFLTVLPLFLCGNIFQKMKKKKMVSYRKIPSQNKGISLVLKPYIKHSFKIPRI